MRPQLVVAVLVLAVGVAAAASVGNTTLGPTDTEPRESPGDTEEPRPPGEVSSEISSNDADIEAYGEEMPASTGWFLIPILSDEPTSVHVEFTWRLDTTDDQPKIATPVLLQHEYISTYLATASHDKNSSVHALGAAVDCCTARFDGEEGRAVSSGWYGTGPDSPLYLGLAATGWSEGDNFTLLADSPDADLWEGSTLTGTHVEAVNLFERARETPHVRLGGENPIGGHEDINLDWKAQDNALVAVAWDLDEARADIEVSLPNGTSVDNTLSTGTMGWISAAGGSGDVRLSFNNASRENPEDGEGYALFADIRASHTTLDTWQN